MTNWLPTFYPRWTVRLILSSVFMVTSACALFSPSEPVVGKTEPPAPPTLPASAAPTASQPALQPTLTMEQTAAQPAPTLIVPTRVPEQTFEPLTPTIGPQPPTSTETPEQPAPTAGPPTPTPDFAAYVQETWFARSPDGLWEVIGTVALPPDHGGATYYTRLDVLSLVDEEAWVVVDQWNPLGLGYTTPRILTWSEDGASLYLTNRPVPDGCAVYVNGSDLVRVSLATGEVETLVPSSGLWLALSPDETRLAYIGYAARGLVVRDLASGEEQETNLDPGGPYSAGDITWAPDGSAVVLGLGISPCSGDWAAGVSLVRVDFPSLTLTELLPADERLFRIMDWTENGVLIQDKEGQFWRMDPASGDLIKEG
jgi:hypothetical protein